MSNTLDIIIPVYNNSDGLFDSLCSIGGNYNLPIGKIIIVDDGSSKGYNYKNIIDFFKTKYCIDYIHLHPNGGPAAARNQGLREVTANYVMFLDCGDTICNQNILAKVFDDIEENPNIWMFSYAHAQQAGQNEYDDEYISSNHNRLMGKVFKKEFLEKFNIRFNTAAGYSNEDIGFNTLCRLICSNEKDEQRIGESDDLFVRWTYDPNSLTRVDNHAFYFRAALGMAQNKIYAYNEALKRKVDFSLIRKDAYDLFCFIYFLYFGAANTRPELIDDVFAGALYFYKEYFDKMETDFNPKLFLDIYNQNLLSLDFDDPYFVNFPSFTIIDFLNKLEKESKGG